MNSKTRLWSFVACFVTLAILAYQAGADITKDTAWTNAAGGAWADGGNWNNGVPDLSAAAIFNLGTSSAYTVTFGGAGSAGELRVRTGTIDFALGTQTLSIGDVLFVGYEVGDDAHLRPDNGLLTSTWADVGRHTSGGGAPGRMTFTGPDASWVNAMDVTVGRGTVGRLDVLEGASVTISRYSFVGNSGSGEPDAADGTLNVGGLGSGFLTQRLTIGYAGNGGTQSALGTVNVTDQATLTCSAGQIAVGSGGQGYLTVSGASTVVSHMGTSPSFSSGVIGAAYPGYYGQGVVALSDVGTSWTQDGSLSVGFNGDGTLTVEVGATAGSRWAHVARRAGSIGQATITGNGSAWTVDEELYVGGEAAPSRGGSGQGGQGRLDVADHATVVVGERLELWDQGTVNVSAGGRLLVGSGAMPAQENSLYVTAGGLLTGTGEVQGAVVGLGGVIAPGHSIGVLTLDGLDQQGGKLEFEIAGPAIADRIDVDGAVTFAGGDLAVSLFGGFVPTSGDNWTIMTADSFTGHEALGVTGGYSLSVDGLRLVLTYDSLPGDCDYDGDVDLDDLSTLASNWNAPSGMTWGDGDFDGDGDVDLDDLSALAANWQYGVTGAAVPEPATTSLLGIGALTLIRRRK